MPPTIPQSLVHGYVIKEPGRQVTPEEAFAEFLLDLRQQMKRTAQQAFDFSHPVDEYQSGSGTFNSPLEIQPTYALFSERIEYIVIAGFPTTATGVVLTLGDRIIPIDASRIGGNGGIISIDCGFVLKPHERRLLSYATNGPQNGYFVGLFGHASDVFETV